MNVFKPGDEIAGRYRLQECIGEGGYAEVFEATEVKTGKSLALKVLRAEHADDPEAVARFQREGSVTSRLSHPHIARTLEFGKLPDGRLFMVMERLEGQDLSTFLLEGGRLEPIVAVELIRQVGEALAAAHQIGFIHRDLKPENIFIVERPNLARGRLGTFKILDFGATRKMADGFGLTGAGLAIGTPDFMSPEQATGETSAVDHRADQFSLGVLAFQLFTGTLPFEAKNVVQVLLKVANDPPPAFASCDVDLPAGVEAAVRKALSKKPEDRFADVAAFVEALRACVPALHGLAGPASETPKPVRRTRVLYTALALVCIAIAIACAFAILQAQ